MTLVTTQDQVIEEKKTIIETSHDIYFRDAINIVKDLEPESVHLVVTSPPYWSIKDYGNPEQIGYQDSLSDYFKKLNKVWDACITVLKPGCKLAINIGDQFLSSKNRYNVKQVYQIIPIHALLVNDIVSRHQEDIVYLGSISWSKVTTSNTSGGGKIMGSVYYPRNGYFFINREYIAVFRKIGNDPKVKNKFYKELSRFTLEERRLWFKDTWEFPGTKQTIHQAMFPEELPYRLIRMYSLVGDTVLDPFLGSGTTTKVAAGLGRNSIGYEIGFTPPENIQRDWKAIIKEKVSSYKKHKTLESITLSPSFYYHE